METIYQQTRGLNDAEGRSSYMVVGLQSDRLQTDRERSVASQVAAERLGFVGVPTYLCSSKTGDGVDNLKEQMYRILEERPSRPVRTKDGSFKLSYETLPLVDDEERRSRRCRC